MPGNKKSNKNIEIVDLTQDDDIKEESLVDIRYESSSYKCICQTFSGNKSSSSTTTWKTDRKTITEQRSSTPNDHNIKIKKLKSIKNSYVFIDCMKGLKMLPNNSVQCIVTSPPYNKLGLLEGRPYNCQIIYDTYDDNMDENTYKQWQCDLLDEINRVLTPTGSLFYNHKDRRRSKRDHPPEEFILQSKLTLYQTIIWDRGSTANQNPGYFRPNNEKVFWLTKSSSATSLPPKFHRDRLPECFKSCIWRIPPDRQNQHPAPFPSTLAEICILATTDPGDLVLDPFAGSGTTLVAAANLNRCFLGFDISKKYQSMFQQRLAKSKSQIRLWEEKFVVEQILNRRTYNGYTEYLLKWKGFSEKESTWESADNLYCPDLLKQFEASFKKRKREKSSNAPISKKSHAPKMNNYITSSSDEEDDKTPTKRRKQRMVHSKQVLASNSSDDDY